MLQIRGEAKSQSLHGAKIPVIDVRYVHSIRSQFLQLRLLLTAQPRTIVPAIQKCQANALVLNIRNRPVDRGTKPFSCDNRRVDVGRVTYDFLSARIDIGRHPRRVQ